MAGSHCRLSSSEDSSVSRATKHLPDSKITKMCRQNICVLFLFILSVSLIPITEQQGSRTTHKREYSGSEVARQNKITQQILAQYLQKRLFPHLMVNTPPSAPPRGANESDEALDSDESEQISSHVSYDDEEEDEDEEQGSDCANCVEDGLGSAALNRWTMPLLKLGEKRYYLGIFFKANWYKSAQYCRYHGMHLASISSQQENDQLEKHIRDSGFGHEHFWTSGTDQGEEGHFFWMSTGRPLTFTNWNAGEPNNFRYENGEEEHCLELWNRDGKGLKWNDTPCSFETYFVCEVN